MNFEIGVTWVANIARKKIKQLLADVKVTMTS